MANTGIVVQTWQDHEVRRGSRTSCNLTTLVLETRLDFGTCSIPTRRCSAGACDHVDSSSSTLPG